MQAVQSRNDLRTFSHAKVPLVTPQGVELALLSVGVSNFYLIAGLLFYTALNVSHIEQIIVDNNLERYERTDKIDINYLNSLSYTGVSGLIQLYQEEPNYPGLQRILRQRKDWVDKKEASWQSFNITKQRVVERLEKLDLN